jgi:hypothetical protein
MAMFLRRERDLEVSSMVTKSKSQSYANWPILHSFATGQVNLVARDMTALHVRKGEVIYRPGQPLMDGESGSLYWESREMLSRLQSAL